jgi:hypothetical protein
VVVSGLQIPVTCLETTCKDSNDCSIKVGSIDVILNENNGNILSDVLPRTYLYVGGKFKVDHPNTAAVHKRKLINTLSKPRMALIQWGENDEPMNHQLNSTVYIGNSGSISASKQVFFGVRYKKNYEINSAGNYIFIGTMLVKIKDDAPG